MTARHAVLVVVFLAAVVQAGFAARLLAASWSASNGDAALQERDFVAASERYARATRLAPYRADWMYARAGSVRDSQGDAAAMPLYERALANAPHAEEPMIAAAESLIDLGRHEEAAALVARAHAVTPFDWRAHYLDGVLATIYGRPAEAVAALRAAADLAPGANATIQNPLANALYSTGEFNEAAREARRAVQLQPDNPAHRLVLGRALLAGHQPAEARAEFTEAVAGYRNRLAAGADVVEALAESETGLALALIDAGTLTEALAPLQRVADLSADAAGRAAQRLAPWLEQSGGDAPFGYWTFAIDALIEAGRGDDAENLIAQAERVHGELSDQLVPAKARVLVHADRGGEALSLLKSAPGPVQTTPEYGLAVGLSHARLGNAATAGLELQTLLRRRDLTVPIRRQAVEALNALPTN